MEKLKSSMKDLQATHLTSVKGHIAKFVEQSYLHEAEEEEEEDVATAAAAIASSSGTMKRWERLFFSPHTTKSIMEEAKSEKGERSDHLLYEKSVMLSVHSTDPYRDFRASMEEMVTALELREWRSLQELLHCYLKVNQRKNHKAIVLAFMDFLLHLIVQNKEAFATEASLSPPPPPDQ
ncbi:transcription repressor OFP13-like [Zingiber officinale]|nr:transcription repressor OFP13-like [Zingiber officinale]